MKLFLDSAKTDEIKHALAMWDLDGITTNPRHVRDSGKPFLQVIDEIAELVGGTNKPVSVEVNPHLTDWRQILAEGLALAKRSPNFVIKVGASEAGFKAMRELSPRRNSRQRHAHLLRGAGLARGPRRRSLYQPLPRLEGAIRRLDQRFRSRNRARSSTTSATNPKSSPPRFATRGNFPTPPSPEHTARPRPSRFIRNRSRIRTPTWARRFSAMPGTQRRNRSWSSTLVFRYSAVARLGTIIRRMPIATAAIPASGLKKIVWGCAISHAKNPSGPATCSCVK